MFCDMHLSVSITDFGWPAGPAVLAARLGDVARRADEAGIDTLWMSDHLIQTAPGSDSDSPMLEAYTTLGYLAARTERIRLGTMVTAATYRPAALLVKAVTTLDVLSGGRAWLGIGAGYHEQEAGQLGLPLPPPRERAERLEETLEVALRMWSGDDGPFAGRHLRLGRPAASPRPLSRPHPPILIGGAGERRTLPLVARYADACNLFDIPDGGRTIARKLEVLARLCDELGRDGGEIEKTVSTRLEAAESSASFTARCAALARLGIDHAVAITAGPWSDDALDVVAAGAAALRQA
jgi:F420-dependent oxidoreductase-like protein